LETERILIVHYKNNDIKGVYDNLKELNIIE